MGDLQLSEEAEGCLLSACSRPSWLMLRDLISGKHLRPAQIEGTSKALVQLILDTAVVMLCSAEQRYPNSCCSLQRDGNPHPEPRLGFAHSPR